MPKNTKKVEKNQYPPTINVNTTIKSNTDSSLSLIPEIQKERL
ncbi:hypothetical protein HMPREF1988_01890 [Porphyromonas gingivalis F0185]|nr:hypothetical protein HMPREF1988_01890 [Porphyromonas gingivalis F0185]